MESNSVNRAPAEARPPSAGPISAAPVGQPQLPPRPPLTRADSRSNFLVPQQRPAAPLNTQPAQRPQFQPGGPVTNPPQFVPRSGTPAPRGPAPPGVQQAQGPRVQATTVRPTGPQPFAPQQGPRPQLPVTGPPLRAPPPNNLQFGPRQPTQFSGGSTPDGSKPYIAQPINGVSRNGVPSVIAPTTQLSRQPSQGSIKGPDPANLHAKQVNLDNQSVNNDNQNTIKPEVYDIPGAPKSRSYSIAAPPGAPSPLKMEDDRRKSISVVGGRVDEITSRSPGLGLIQESQDNIRGSKESVRSEASIEGRDVSERPESRLSASKMSESFIGSLPTSNIKKKSDDDDDVVLQNTGPTGKNLNLNQNKVEISDRSPSLSRSDDSPEPKQPPPTSTAINRTGLNQNGTPEPQRPKTPKTPVKSEIKSIESCIDASAKHPPRSPMPDSKPPVQKKPTELNTSSTPSDSKKSTPRKTASAPKYKIKDGDNDSGVDESTQGNELNGSPGSPSKKTPSKLPTKEKSNGSLKPSLSRSSSKSATAKTPENPTPAEKKKVPMNKVQVGNAPSPNIKAVKSKIGSLENSTYKPGGGKVKIENRKLDFQNVTPKIAAKNDQYAPSGGSKKITTTKLEWNAKSKIGSLQNTTYRPGGGDKKIETVKLDFKEKAKPKVASTVNITHKPGGGAIKFVKWALPRWRASHKRVAFHALWSQIENQKLEFKAQSKVGSLDNVKHKPKGGDVKIFDDKEYIKQMTGQSPAPISRTESRQESPIPPTAAQPPKSDVNLNQQQ